MQDTDDGRQLILQTQRCSTVSQLQTSFLQGLQHSECIVQTQH